MLHYALTMPIKSGPGIDLSSPAANPDEYRELCLQEGQSAHSERPVPTDKTFVLKNLGIVLSVPDALVKIYKALDGAFKTMQADLNFGRFAVARANNCLAPCATAAGSVSGVHHPACFDLLGELPQHLRTDTVVEHLINALSAMEIDESESSLVYADAVRLALMTRLIGGFNEGHLAKKPCLSKTPLPKWRLKKAIEYIDEHLSRTIALKDLAAAAGLSRMHFAAQFRAATGLRPREFVLNRRIELSKHLMIETQNSLVDIALTVGFQTQAHFTTVFKRFVGDTPHSWRCGHPRGELPE